MASPDFIDYEGERYETERFIKLIAEAAPKGPSKLVEMTFADLIDFSGGAPLADDVSVLALTFLGKSQFVGKLDRSNYYEYPS